MDVGIRQVAQTFRNRGIIGLESLLADLQGLFEIARRLREPSQPAVLHADVVERRCDIGIAGGPMRPEKFERPDEKRIGVRDPALHVKHGGFSRQGGGIVGAVLSAARFHQSEIVLRRRQRFVKLLVFDQARDAGVQRLERGVRPHRTRVGAPAHQNGKSRPDDAHRGRSFPERLCTSRAHSGNKTHRKASPSQQIALPPQSAPLQSAALAETRPAF